MVIHLRGARGRECSLVARPACRASNSFQTSRAAATNRQQTLEKSAFSLSYLVIAVCERPRSTLRSSHRLPLPICPRPSLYTYVRNVIVHEHSVPSSTSPPPHQEELEEELIAYSDGR